MGGVINTLKCRQEGPFVEILARMNVRDTDP
jgi:hypothetical protein